MLCLKLNVYSMYLRKFILGGELGVFLVSSRFHSLNSSYQNFNYEFLKTYNSSINLCLRCVVT